MGGPQPRRVRGIHARPLLQSQIEHAQRMTNNNSEAARFLNVHYQTYKKYAKLYGLFDSHKNQGNHNVKRAPYKNVTPLTEILENKHPNYNKTKLKERLIATGFLREECSLCGFSGKRLTDDKCPLILDFKDGNSRNFTLTNLQLHCYNCTYLMTTTNAAHRKINASELPPPSDETSPLEEIQVPVEMIEEIQNSWFESLGDSDS